MLFLVDGYNVTKGDPATQGLTLESQREALVARLRVRGLQLLGKGRIVVVFDGDAGRVQGGDLGRAATHPVDVVFSRGGSADDAIVERAALAREAGVCVVTSDRGLADRVREHVGAQVGIRPREVVFESARGAASAKKRRGSVAREAGLPPGANSITEEMKRHWLDGEE
jgi:predicted RNA-binding protein with PIN domain